MQILLIIILAVIGILTLTGLFFFYDKIKDWVLLRWKKILAVFITAVVTTGGWILIESDTPALLNKIPSDILIWHPSPINSFGSAGYYEIDEDVHFEYFSNHTKWELYHSTNGNEWKPVEGLDITSIFDKNNISEKVTLNFTALKEGYYKIQYSVDTYVKAYKREETDYIIKLEFPIENMLGSYVAYFDWTDIIETKSPVHYSYGFIKKEKYDYFHFLITTDYLESGTFMSIDPTFGSTHVGTTQQDIKKIVAGFKGSQPSSSGDVDNITIRVNEGAFSGSRSYKAGIYDSSKNKLTNGDTDEVEVSFGANQNIVFPFSGTKPSVTASNDYWLVVVADDTEFGNAKVYWDTSGSYTFAYTDTGSYSLPSSLPAVWDSTDTSADAYFSASMGEGAANTAPTVDYKTPTNGTTNIDQITGGGVRCEAYVNDSDGDFLDVTWATNESGIWVNKHTDSPQTANTTPDYTFSDFDTYNTTYYWKVYVDDGTDNESEVYHFSMRTYDPIVEVDISDATIGVNWNISGKSWAEVRALATGNTTDGLDAGCTIGTMEGSNTTGAQSNAWTIIRYFGRFNTSHIGVNNQIDSCSFFLYDLGSGESTGNLSWSIQEGTQGDTVTNIDFDAFTGNAFANYTGMHPPTGGYMELVFDANAKDKISKTGWTYFCIRQRSQDYLNAEPAALNYFKFYGHGETDKRPYMRILFSTFNDPPTQSAQKIWDSGTSTEKTLNATDVSRAPTCFNVTINDPDGDKMNITIRTNESGSWTTVNQTSGSGLSNGTTSYTNTSWIDTYSTKYWVSFNVTDGTDWVNETYNFTTKAIPVYNTSVRTNGVDYFVWLGDNVSAWHIYQIIDSLGFDEGIEYIAVWRNQ